jgi:synaptic vesicle membrane protein VAT-1
MKRVVIARPGGYDALRLETAPDPSPRTGEVLIAVEAAGVNYADGIIRMGLYASAKQLHGYPITPGFEVAGRIVAVGDEVDAWRVGDDVVALTLFGGYTSHLCVAADRVFARPAALTAQQAAAIPCVFLTAWFMAMRQLQPQPGDRWLVHSAAGGVGGALVQLGVLAGCRVTGVVGNAEKIDTARAAGCSEVIVRRRGERAWRDEARASSTDGYQAVFDANGVATLSDSYALLAPMGTLAIYGFASMLPRDGKLNWLRLAWDWLRTPRFDPMKMTQMNRSVIACNLSFLSAHAGLLTGGMQWLLARFGDGTLMPPPVTAYPLARVADAQRAIESGRTTGKLVLIP